MNSKKKILGFALFLTSATVSLSQTVVDILPQGISTNEPCIAIHPKYPAFQVMGSNTSFFWISEDFALNWKQKTVTPPEGYYGDPVVYITKTDYIYFCHLAANPKKTGYAKHDRIVFEVSNDNGQSFKSIGVGLNGNKMQDKPWMAVDENKKSKFRNRVYLSWTEFDKYESKNPEDSSRIRFAYSDNYGDTFSQPITVSDTSGDALDGDNTLEGATIAVGPKGELYMVWGGKNGIWFDKSLDGGKTWGKDQIIEKQHGGWELGRIPFLYRANSMPFATCDNKGNIYVTWGDNRNGDQDVFLLISKDGGKTWLPTIRVNNDAVKNGLHQFNPNLCKDRSTGKVYIAFYDRRHSENNIYTDVYVAPVEKLKVKRNLRVTNASFCPPGKNIFMGDYISIAAEKKEIRVAYTKYDHEKLIPTVNVSLLNEKMIKRISAVKEPNLQALLLKDTQMLYLHLEAAQIKTGTLEISRANQSVYKQILEGITDKGFEVMLPQKKIGNGLFKITFTSGVFKTEREVYIGK